jgi:hypothetical protein
MRALSIRQPWAWLIVNGHKTIENRDWSTAFRGPVLIHASLTMTQKYHRELSAQMLADFAIELPAYDALERGGIVGVAEIVDCLTAVDIVDYGESFQRWFTGEHGFVIARARPLPFHPCKGALSFFDVRGVPL